MDFTPVPTIKKENAKQITTPITIFADNDIIFPGKKMIKRVKNIFPSQKKAHLINDSKHVQNETQNTIISEIILKAKSTYHLKG